MSDRAEWLEWRKKGLGSSDVAAILGVSPWASPWSVWADKAGLTDNDTDSEAMEFGRRAEAMVGPWFHDVTGLYLAGEQTWCHHGYYPYRRCTVDGFVVESPDSAVADAIAVGEVKTTSDAAKKWEEGGIPAHYEAQAAWQAHVTGLPDVWFIVVHLAYGRPQFRVYKTTPSPADIEMVVDAADRFWHDHVLTGTPPPVDDHRATTSALNAAWPDPEPDPPVDADDALMATVRELDAIKRHIKADEIRKEALENVVKAALADRTTLAYDGTPVATWKPQQRLGIDAKAVRLACGDKFDTHSTNRVLRLSLPDTNHKKEPTP